MFVCSSPLARAIAPALSLALATAAGAQPPAASAPLAGAAGLFTGGELETYLRTLQVDGAAPAYPWSLRGLSRFEVDSLRAVRADVPWAGRYDLDRPAADAPAAGARRARVQWLRPTVGLRYNSDIPFGSNDGAVWAGRGLTSAVQAGVAASWGPVSLTLAPIAFRAENEDVPLRGNNLGGPMRFAHGVFPTTIDAPQRFGERAYQRIDPGQSTLRVDAFGATAGVSTANVWWGPAAQYPFLLGTNAPGFAHVFVGTARPASIGIGRVHARVLWGRLEQSEYFDPGVEPFGIARARRFAAGLVAVFEPAAVPGLELGAARFFHAPWPDAGLPGRYFTRPFQGVTKESLDQVENPIPGDPFSQDGENQLASVFGRWVLPRSGFELWFEYGRDDHNATLRDLLQEPDHQASVLWGVRKTWRRAGRQLLALRVESMNFERNDPSTHFRGGGAIYAHASGSNQGHTNRGQLLGADAGVGSGAGAIAALDWYRPDGRWTGSWTRTLRGRADVPFDPGRGDHAVDVIHSLGVERLLFAGPWDVTAGLTGAYNFNRDFERDRRNLSVFLAVTGLPR